MKQTCKSTMKMYNTVSTNKNAAHYTYTRGRVTYFYCTNCKLLIKTSSSKPSYKPWLPFLGCFGI